MAECPSCGSDGSDILLTKVFCPNEACQWFDQVTADRLSDTVDSMLNKFIRDIRAFEQSKSDPDITPLFHPQVKKSP